MNNCLVNGIVSDQLNIADRGLTYGDGLFETIAVINRRPIFWQAHIQRMRIGAQRLNIPFSDSLAALFYTDLTTLINQASAPNQVLKLLLTRGVGLRGYKASPDPVLTRVVTISDKPSMQVLQNKGITATLCKTQLARQPLLAGIKHLNRLEQVLARNEWDNPNITEGIVCDTQGNVIEGCMSNLFWIKDRVLYTPDLSFSGVNGIIRQVLIDLYSLNNKSLPNDDSQLEIPEKSTELLGLKISDYRLSDVFYADEVFMCNSVFDILPVTKIVDCDHLLDRASVCFPVGVFTQKAQQALQQLYIEETSC